MPELFDSNYFRGQGPLMIADRDASGNPTGFEFVGDLASVSIAPNMERFEVIENTTGQGGVGASGLRRSSYNVTVGFRSVKPSHLAQAIHGTVTTKASGSVTAETATAKLDKFSKLAHTNVSNVVITGTGGTPSYVADTDYKVHAEQGMIEWLSGGTITDDTAVEIDYDYAAQKHLTVSPHNTPKYLVFNGINSANADKTARVELYKIKFDPGAMDLISDEPVSMEISGVLELDSLRASGDQFYGMQLQD